MTNLRALDPDQELRPAWLTSELFPFTSRFVDIDDARIHYVDEGSGPILLFLHGAPNWSFSIDNSSARFIDSLPLRDIILVVGDAGGPIGLGVAARHPEWFVGLVLGGTFGW